MEVKRIKKEGKRRIDEMVNETWYNLRILESRKRKKSERGNEKGRKIEEEDKVNVEKWKVKVGLRSKK